MQQKEEGGNWDRVGWHGIVRGGKRGSAFFGLGMLGKHTRRLAGSPEHTRDLLGRRRWVCVMVAGYVYGVWALGGGGD